MYCKILKGLLLNYSKKKSEAIVEVDDEEAQLARDTVEVMEQL